MSVTQLNLTNNQDWSYRGRVFKTAKKEVINRRERFFPIPKFDLGFSLNGRFLAIEILVKEARVTWHAGGFINQFYPVPFITQSVPKNQAVSNSQFLLINKTNLINFPRLSGQSYRLIYSPPKWFRDVTVKLWQYRGEEINFTDDTVVRIEEKVDQLL